MSQKLEKKYLHQSIFDTLARMTAVEMSEEEARQRFDEGAWLVVLEAPVDTAFEFGVN